MNFMRLFGSWFNKWPSAIPRYYPNLDEIQLASFLTPAEYHRISKFTPVYILPFVSDEEEDEEQLAFGCGLSYLMIRNLMLLNDISIRGPEDTEDVTYESAEDASAFSPRAMFLAGMATFHNSDLNLQARLYQAGNLCKSAHVRSRDLRDFVRECSEQLGKMLGSRLERTAPEGWNSGQPRDLRSIIRCGNIPLEFDEPDERRKALLDALEQDPDFVIPAWHLDTELPSTLPVNLKALVRDPHNPQLFFQTFLCVWDSRGSQPEALQFCRKAIELSPGHGKAHMCAPHAAPISVDTLGHSELGYRLLPGNHFAVHNYRHALGLRGAPLDRLIELAEEGMATDPFDPGAYMAVVDACIEREDYDRAVKYAIQLQRLYEPDINDRTLYCLRQNPEIARQMAAGVYVPKIANRKLIAKLKKMAAKKTGDS